MQVRELFFEPQHSDENLEWLCLPVTPTSGGRESLRAQWPSSLAEPTSIRLREKIQSQGDKVEGEYDTWNCSGLRKPMHGTQTCKHTKTRICPHSTEAKNIFFKKAKSMKML